MDNSKVALRLFIDTRSNKVLFVEARKDFIDFIFSLLTLPLGLVTKLLSPLIMIGSLENLYKSIEDLNQTHFVPNRDKSSLLRPKLLISDLASPLFLGTEVIEEPTYYLCNSCKGKMTATKNTICPNCKQKMTGKVEFVVPSFGDGDEGESSVGGFVKDGLSYAITDDLEVKPFNGECVLDFMDRFGLKAAQLEVKVVLVGKKEGLALLKASLETRSVFTNVFSSPTMKRKALLDSRD